MKVVSFQTLLLAAEIVACALVFVACCNLRPVLMIPIIVIQASTTNETEWEQIICFRSGTQSASLEVEFISASTLMTSGVSCTFRNCCFFPRCFQLMENFSYIIFASLFSLCFSLFILHCHTCCYKLLLFMKLWVSLAPFSCEQCKEDLADFFIDISSISPTYFKLVDTKSPMQVERDLDERSGEKSSSNGHCSQH